MEKEKFLSKRVGIVIGSILFALCFLGVTYAAYLTGQTYNEVNTASMVTPDVSYTEDKTMMLQGILPTPRDIAIKAAALNGCYDKSEKPIPVCSLYEFTVTNTSLDELDQKVKFYLNIEENTYANYYYMVFDGEKENVSEDKAPIIDSTHLPNNDLGEKYLFPLTTELTPGQTKTYTILFYINETGENQLYIDTNKVFSASVKVEASTSGKYDDRIKLLKGSVPDLENSGLTPIVYDGENWVVADMTEKWYDYENQWWANAAILKSGVSKEPGTVLKVPDGSSITESQSNVYAMFVWIPRFSYTIGCTSSSSCLGYKVEEASALSIETPGAIDIKFVSVADDIEIPDMDNGIYPNYTYTNETDRTPTNYYTHPAFWWDKNGDGVRPEDNSEELSGIWVGKFETSVDSTSTCYTSASYGYCYASGSDITPRILPNVKSLRSQTVYDQFETAKKFSASGNIYGIDNTKTDSHMMKNSEWSAVAYLSQSIYGKYGNSTYSGTNKEIYINNNNSFYTGISAGAPSTSSSSSITCRYNVIADRGSGTGACGAGASTTGNIYGVYDMSGGLREYVMGNYNNTVSSSGISSSWFKTTSNIKYYDKFTITEPFTTKNKQTMGQSLYEVAGWYGDNKDSFDSSSAWLSRGGSLGSSRDGAFNGYTGNGNEKNPYGFRSVFVMTIA